MFGEEDLGECLVVGGVLLVEREGGDGGFSSDDFEGRLVIRVEGKGLGLSVDTDGGFW